MEENAGEVVQSLSHLGPGPRARTLPLSQARRIQKDAHRLQHEDVDQFFLFSATHSFLCLVEKSNNAVERFRVGEGGDLPEWAYTIF